ncbi:MAG: conjugal transfer protein TraX [Lachnospiraceae bacterium]|nr:conjugal transfer protein TraX [Lachnospiraceae bacterium]
MEKRFSLSGAVLKNAAYISMFIDHFFAVVFNAYMRQRAIQGLPIDSVNSIYQIGRAIGRVAFILFAFMAVEGFCHTRSRMKYLLRLGAFALISEIPFDLAIEDSLFEMSNQNVYFTLFLGVLALCIISKLRGHPIVQFLGVALCCIAAALLKTDYMFMGVMLIVVFYLCRKSFLCQVLVGSVTIYVGIVLLYIVRYWGWGFPITVFLESGLSEMYGLFAFVFIFFYNGQKGKQLPKACYYLFYPLHLLLLYGIKQWMF